MPLSRRSVIAGVSALALALPNTPARANVLWRAYTYQGGLRPANAARLMAASDILTSASAGKFRIDFHLGNTLPIDVSQLAAACGRGDIQLGDDTFFLNTLIEGNILQLPMLVSSRAEYRRVMAIVEPNIVRAYEGLGCEVLGRYDFIPVHLYGAGDRPIASLADIAGRRIRTGRQVHNDFIEAYRGIPLTMVTPDVMRAFQDGRIDGVLTGFAGGASVWHNHLTSVLIMNLYYGQGYFIANRAALAALPRELSDLVRSQFRNESETVTATMLREDDEVIATFRARGMQFSELSASEVGDAQAKAAIVWERWASQRGPEAEALLLRVRAELGR
jgi:TRAP-type C4-dicarboxylate transport system substrate-binding protein